MTWFRNGLACSMALLILGTLSGGERGKKPMNPDPLPRQQEGLPAPRLDRYGDRLPDWAAARLGTLRWRSNGDHVFSAALSPDGRMIALAGSRALYLVDAATGQETRRLPGVPAGLGALAFTPDGKTLVAGDYGRIFLWDPSSGQKKSELVWKTRQPRVSGLSFSADGRYLTTTMDVYGQGNAGVPVWDLSSQKELGPFPALQNGRVGAALSADGKHLLTWGSSSSGPPAMAPQVVRTLQLWDVATVKEVRQFKTELGFVAYAALSPDGKTLAAITGSNLATLSLFDVQTAEERQRMAGRRGQIHLVFSPDSRRLATATSEGAIQLWDVASGKRLGGCEVPGGRPIFTSDGRVLALASLGLSVGLWEVPSGKPLTGVEGHAMRIVSLAFSGDGKTLFSSSQDGKVCIWDTANGLPRSQFVLHDPESRGYASPGQRFFGLALSGDGKHAAGSSTYSNSTRLLNLETGKVVCDLEGYRSSGDAGLAFSPDGSLLAAGDNQGHYRLWNIHTGQEVARVKSHRPRFEQVGGLAFSPDSRTFALLHNYHDRSAVSDLHLIRIGDGKEAGPVRSLGTHARGVTFSADSQIVLVGGTNGTIHSWDVATGQERRALAAGPGFLHSLACSPDGRTIAAATVTNTAPPSSEPQTSIVLIERSTGGVRARFMGHRGMIEHLAFGPDGRILASAGGDTTILLWDLTGHSCPGLTLAAPTAAPTPDQGDALWSDLAGSDAEQAFKVMLRLRAFPKETVTLLAHHLRPVAGIKSDAASVAQWISDLDSEKFAIRDKAQKSLLQLGEPAIAVLRKALEEKPSLEKRQRVESLLRKLTSHTLSPEELRGVRAVEVLEALKTPQARSLLRTLAGGAPSPLTHHARDALGRLR